MNLDEQLTNLTGFLQESFVRQAVSPHSWLYITVTFGVIAVIAGFIFWTYQKTYTGVIYSYTFNVSLVAIAFLTSMIIMAIGSNLILSLGMVGALSIVRFRTPVKDPLDLIFLFWAIAAGIVTGAGFYLLSLVGSAVIGLTLFICLQRTKPAADNYLLIIQASPGFSEQPVLEILATTCKRIQLRSKWLTEERTELTYEVRITSRETNWLADIRNIDGVQAATMVSAHGDTLG